MAARTVAERILEFIQARGYQPRQLGELAQALGMGEDEQGDFHAACRALMRSGRVVLGEGNALMLPGPSSRLTGAFRANRRGFGFVVPDTPNAHGDLYVPAGATHGAMTGDRVVAAVQRRGKREGKMVYEGRILRIVERSQSRFVGELRRQGGKWFVLPDGQTLHAPILVGDPTAKSGGAGDQVVVEMIEYPAEGREARGAIVKVLGPRGEPDVDTLSIVEQYQLPDEFPENVVEEARRAAADYDVRRDAVHREDLQEQTIITIDPADARDFDDAISLTKNRDGSFELGVHIADVSHFVVEGGELDVEARRRANSVYLPRKVIPMLPEVLSNGVCSLQERQPRLAKSVLISFGRDGHVLGSRFANSIIRSGKRLTYEQAQAILDGKAGRTSAKVVALLTEMERLARVIRARRLKQGMLSLDFPDAELVFDADGRVKDVIPEDTSFTHTIIEMFMVEANEAVARLFATHETPCLRRVHGPPDDLANGTLQRLVKALGCELPRRPQRHDLQKLLDDVREAPQAFAIHLAVLRSMQQAEYSPNLVGHYALASEHYCHFTSPIRRYPDLTVHRRLERYLQDAGGPQEALAASSSGRGIGRSRMPARPDALMRASNRSARSVVSRTGTSAPAGLDDLKELGGHCSTSERRAESAERELKLVLILRFLEKHIGDAFDGIVTGVANIGLFVQIQRYFVEGLIKFDALSDDWWEVDASRGAIIGQRSGRSIRLGDRLRVAIARIHIPTRRLDLQLVEPTKRRSRSAPHRGERRSKEFKTVSMKDGRRRKQRRGKENSSRRHGK